jgi:molybdopterin-containing oxidoreductase family membrane subunit
MNTMQASATHAEVDTADQSWVEGDRTLGQITADIADHLDGTPSKWWWIGMGISLSALGLGGFCIVYLMFTGIGCFGLNKTIGWAFEITNFVFWVGIGHAGTLISAILYLLRQRWRTAVNRSAEAMTLIAVMCAGLFPLMHMGRPWFFFYLAPYPNTRGSLWMNFRSPLVWDMLAISTYFTVSLVFWYLGLIPDLATLRDRAKGIKKFIYGIFSFGWNGSSRTWHHYELVYLILAGLATPLVLSVHSVVSSDFATSLIPGWHTTIFPPYFVAGAIFSGFAMVLTLMLVARKTMRFENYITMRHIETMTKVMLLTSMIVGLAYMTEFFIAWYSGDRYEQQHFLVRFLGPSGWWAFIMYGCNMLIPQVLWFKAVRRNLFLVFIITLTTNVGMWFERWVIIVSSLQTDYLPSSWEHYHPTPFDYGVTLGSFGLFFTMFLLFARFLPMIAIAEIKHEAAHGGAPHHSEAEAV